MKLAVVGSDSPTGSEVVRRAREADHTVIEIPRIPLDGPPEPGELAGCDAVVFLMGEPGRSTSVTRSAGMANLVAAVRGDGCGRVLAVSPAEVEISDRAPLARRLVLRFVTHKRNRNIYLDHERMEDELRESGVNWTAVRVPRLYGGGPTGNYRTAEGGYLAGARPLSRADLADSLLALARDDQACRRVISVSGGG